MKLTRRELVVGASALAVAGAVGVASRRLRATSYASDSGLAAQPPEVIKTVGAMPYRRFGTTGLEVSEVGFGAWAIGGQAYGTVDRRDSLRALARAEELGCNLVDTAMVYGDSELVLGEFLRERRSRWIVATKYSYQPAGITATLEQQLSRMGTDVVDFYQLHALPEDHRVYDELYALKKAGKVRFVGVSLYSANDIDYLIDHSMIDGVQLRFSLLDPDPFLRRVDRLRTSGLAVLIRSSLKEGFLAGKFRRDATFPSVNDQRHAWSPAQIARTVDQVEGFRFLDADTGSMVRASVAYALSFAGVSSVLLGTKTTAQAETDFGQIPGTRLSARSLDRVLAVQDALDAGDRRSLRSLAKRVLGRY